MVGKLRENIEYIFPKVVGRHLTLKFKANGKHTTSAQIAVMRKMIVIAHSLYKSGEHYNEEKYTNATGRQSKTAE